MTLVRALSIAACSLAIALGSAVGSAQPSDPSQRALKLGYDADNLFARGKWAEAYDRFAEADTLAHSPVFVLYMARCRKNAGRLLEARPIYERVTKEQVPAGAPKPFRDAVTDAATELEELRARIPSVRLVVTGATAGASVRLDDKPIADTNAVIPVDPGAHTADASSGTRTAHKAFTLADGAGTVTIELSFTATPVVTPPPPSRGSLAPGFVALAVGVAGIGVGAVTGGIAASKASDFKPRCINGHCLTSDAAELSSAKTLSTISTIGFIAGGAATAAAVVLFIVRPGRSSSPEKPATSVMVGPGFASVARSF